ncbi:hypothetical protein AXF42_Ash019178 [Apostasia shenzhenica]|uniref:Uncharacterized protein n=1 Tax=Apostasia shenzhenica TaxID=1088818 RepID=A0A2I0B2G3_9ASPA|nr:hypothetical protein AXF42_Ash019178 [Apostasia shenzhenica]
MVVVCFVGGDKKSPAKMLAAGRDSLGGCGSSGASGRSRWEEGDGDGDGDDDDDDDGSQVAPAA